MKLFKRHIMLGLLSVVMLTASAESWRLLCIGNSYSRDAVEKYLYPLVVADGDDIRIVNIFKTGASLVDTYGTIVGDSIYPESHHIVDGVWSARYNVTAAALLNDEWDFISIQQNSFNSGYYNTFSNIPAILQEIKERTNGHGEVLYHQTWSYAQNSPLLEPYEGSAEVMYSRIAECTLKLSEKYPNLGRIVPAGTAIQNCRLNYSLPNELTCDGVHLDSLGCFTAACVWYETITGRDVRQNTYMPRALTHGAIQQAKISAHNAMLSPFSTTSGIETLIADPQNTFVIQRDGDAIRFEPKSEIATRLAIYSTDGLKLYDKTLGGTHLLTLPKGIYLVRIGNTLIRKISL